MGWWLRALTTLAENLGLSHLYGGSQLSVSPVPEDMMSLLTSVCPACTGYTYIHGTGKTLVHI